MLMWASGAISFSGYATSQCFKILAKTVSVLCHQQAIPNVKLHSKLSSRTFRAKLTWASLHVKKKMTK